LLARMFENTVTQESHGGPGLEEVSHLMFGSYLASSTCTLLSPPADVFVLAKRVKA
jgi:hypothetical protein